MPQLHLSLLCSPVCCTSAGGKFRLAALTNNFAPPTARADGANAPSLEEELEHLGVLKGANEVKGLFDDYLESAKIGMR